MEIELNLKNHCIASEIKKLYNRNVSAYLKKAHNLKPDETVPVEKKIELLKKALETLDFSELRSKHPVLAGNTNIPVILGMTYNLELYITIDNKKVELLYSQ